ncbi:AMP-binding protein [Catenovulum adriaticum]|uniref:AMP-binding protein n=1 Tax=Catenovulum adriaticum TaxID=2984846 RepID=A0ABY7AP43_9ALTE|nr:AMP-binding protein [Catenovulum sp. TS8]WAJ71042.1 AMP-binding protein [Catenovulum sp. TS8]
MTYFWQDNLAKHAGFIYDATSTQTVSYSQLNQCVEVFCQSLPEKKSLIALEASNCLASLIAYLALLRTNHCILLLEPELAGVQKQTLLANYQVDFKVELPSDLAAPINLTAVRQHIQLVADPANLQQISGLTYLNSAIAQDIVLLLSTSGSTGSSKLVKLSAKNLQANSTAILGYLPISSTDTVVTSLPMHYSFGLSVIHTHLQVGANIVLSDYSLMQKQFWQLFKQFEPNGFYGVPFSYQLMTQLGLARLALKSCQYFAQAGGKMSDSLTQALFDFCQKTHKSLYIMYGQTEATARIAYLKPAKLPQKIGYIGQAIPGGKLKLIDENGQPVTQTNQTGELYYQGDNVCLGMAHNRQDLTHVNQQEWLATGDLACFDKDGDFKIVGRLKRFIKVTGKRINLDEVEAIVQNSNKTKLSQMQTCVVGEDDQLIVVSNFTLTEPEYSRLVNDLAEKIAIHPKYIRQVHVNHLPCLSNGKLDYRQLLKQVKSDV